MAFGGIPREQTISDIELGSVTSQSVIPSSYFPGGTNYKDYGLTIEAQHQQPACGAHAGCELAEGFYNLRTGNNIRLSPEYLWKRIKLIDGFPISDGTNMLSIMKALQKYGICEADLMSNNTLDSLEDYASPSTLTNTEDSNANLYKIYTYAFQWSPSFQDIKLAIYNHKFVIGLLRVGAEFWTPSWAEKDILPLKSSFPISSGHFVTFFGYDTDYLYFYNHWGNTWGRMGIGYFGEDYASRVLEIGTAIDAKHLLFTDVLSKGSRGSAVSLLQKRLGIQVDGIYGLQTKTAVEAFQRSVGLVPDGIVGKNTNNKLNQ